MMSVHPRVITVVLALVMLAAGCSVSVDRIAVEHRAAAAGEQANTTSGLPAVGPIPASSHWHAAYVVRICDDVLPPFESDDDPLGIHSHGDGIMHVHPFFEESGYESATLALFADAMGFAIRDGELSLPGGGTWRDGDLCNGVPGRVFVDRWEGPDPASEVERIFVGIEDIRYLADGELYQIAFAPVDSFPVVPPSTAMLSEVSNLLDPADPWVDVRGVHSLDDVEVWKIGALGGESCTDPAVSESVLSGPARCFEPTGDRLAGADAVSTARAVMFNRVPAVEIRMGDALRDLINGHFAGSTDPMALAIEVDGLVVSAPQLGRPPVGDRLVVSGGFSIEAARELVETLNNR